MKWHADMMDIIAEGMKAGRQEMIARVLSRQKNIAKTADILDIPYEEVAKVAKDLNIRVNDLLQ